MAETAKAKRTPALEGKFKATAGVRVEPVEPASRLVLRAGSEALAPLSRALGVKLPDTPKTSARSSAARTADRAALWLGPDEWLILDREGVDLMALCAKVKQPHSAVDVSHRNTAILVSGPGAPSVLNAGCPQDLSLAAFPVGACSRTVLGKAEVVLLRVSETEFRVECWRSFADYVFTFLVEATRDPIL